MTALLSSVRTGSVSQRSRMGSSGSPTVTNGSKEPQVAGLPAQAAGMMQAGDSGLWSRRSGFESPRSPHTNPAGQPSAGA
jgi:hypothetical protein